MPQRARARLAICCRPINTPQVDEASTKTDRSLDWKEYWQIHLISRCDARSGVGSTNQSVWGRCMHTYTDSTHFNVHMVGRDPVGRRAPQLQRPRAPDAASGPSGRLERPPRAGNRRVLPTYTLRSMYKQSLTLKCRGPSPQSRDVSHSLRICDHFPGSPSSLPVSHGFLGDAKTAQMPLA